MGENQVSRLGASHRKDCMFAPPERFTIAEERAGSKIKDHRGAVVKQSFVVSIFWQGVLEPIEVRSAGKDGEGDETLEIVYGRKRVRATKIANGWISDPSTAPNEDIRSKAIERQSNGDKIEVPFMMAPKVDDLGRFERTIAENQHRHDTSPVAMARQLADHYVIGGTPQKAVSVFGVTMATIKNWEALLDCCPEVLEAVEDGRLAAVAAADLSGLDEDAQRAALKGMAEQGTMKGYAAREAAQNAAAGKPVKVKQERARVRPRRFLEKARDEFESLEARDCQLAHWIFRYVLGDKTAVRHLPERVAGILKDLEKIKKTTRKAKEA